jgi:1,6-anhydro-N-acetylmuramate kinase
MPTKSTRAIGLMSGTLLDGVSVAWRETDAETITHFGLGTMLEYEDTPRPIYHTAAHFIKSQGGQ